MRILLFCSFCMWLSRGTDAVDLTEMFAEIRSPNFPDSYPTDSEVTWNISVPEGYRIRLYFMHFDLEPSYLCEYDYAKVEAEGQILATFCGRESTDTEQAPGHQAILSPGNSLSLTFRSDFSNEERFTGFDAHYAAVDIDECTERSDEELTCDHYCHNYIGGFYCSCRFGYLLHSDNRTCKVECSDHLFTQRTGVITSADFPNPYPKSSDCLYRIELEEGFFVTLHFEDRFDVEDHPEVSCPYDYVKIKAGRKEFGPFCGEKSPGQIETRSHNVQILFHSDDSGENGGWKLTYSATGNSCPVLQPPVNGKIEPLQSQYTFKEQVLIRCNTGYNVFKDNLEMESLQMECQKDGTWSNKIPTCKIVDCRSPAQLENGFISFPTVKNLTTYRSDIQYSCQLPYYEMAPNISGTYTCEAGGKWMSPELGAKLPTCQPVCGTPRFTRSVLARIAGGGFAKRGISPWIAMLAQNGRPFCGGSLIGNKWIVTAAHCLHPQLNIEDPIFHPDDIFHSSTFKIILGKHRTIQRDDTEQTFQAKSILLHPLYNASTFQFDVGLLELPEKAILNDYVIPVCLPDTTPQKGDYVVVSGWGKQFLGRSPNALLEIEIPVVDHELCRQTYADLGRQVTADMVCAGEKEGGKDACSGDSGGPMVTLNGMRKHWFLAGIVSWGVGCGDSDRYGVYSNVLKSLTWIKDTTHVNY
ncbi:mannan-binding lectin serine protease 1 isoform X2 [Microcaecilia unicolor]|uniref:Mannan-binding lectin serine protease 1 isoform X2 n=1 Tax=Microcaecilia unicolor TaxID=1415580 RepID=A0A6P7Z3K9_9AMPH|nr:mannan-binding lectin serine protease 1 isoform X2 [Microcaecilia unicolor]